MRRKAGQLIPIEVSILDTALALDKGGTKAFHGYALAKLLKTDTQRRTLTAYGTLYRALHRLERAGLVESFWEDPAQSERNGRPRRRLYRVTALAEIALARVRAAQRSGRQARCAQGRSGRAMIRRLQDIAPACARAWLRLYTSGMPADLRDARHADVNTDLWEHQHDAHGEGASRLAIAAEILLRTFVGVPDDLGWRREAMPHGAVIEGRIGTMAITVGQLRWMSLCGVLGGGLLVGARLVEMGIGMERMGALPGVFVLMALLAILGVMGLYVQHRGGIGWTGRAGFFLMLAGWAGVLVGSTVTIFAESPLASLLDILGWVVAIPLGFLLLGIGLPSPSRTAPLIVGCYLVGGYVALVPIVQAVLAPAAVLLGPEAQTIMMGLGLAGIGYAVWSGTRNGSVSAAGGASLTA